MNTESFVNVIKESVCTSAVDATLSTLMKVPGRAPNPKLVVLSNWYNSLTSADQENLKQVVRESVDAALFQLLCVLDGVAAVEPDGNSGTFELIYHREGQSTVITPNESVDYLHDLYNAE